MSDFTENEKNSYLVQVVDDDKVLREVLCLGMSKAGFFVAEASNGHDALNDFFKLQPDVVLLDVIMPEISGFEVCRRIREKPGGERVPIIMITGQDDYQSINNAFDSGATDFVVKPINPLLLSHRIRYILRANQAFNDLTVNKVKLASAREIARLNNWEWHLEDDTLIWGEDMCLMCGIDSGKKPQSYEDFLTIVAQDDSREVHNLLKEALYKKNNFSFEHRVVTETGKELVLKQDGNILTSSKGVPVKVLFTCQDITERIRTEEKIKFLAYYDRLTGLPNRALFKEHLEKAISKSRRSGQYLSVLLIDIDNFRMINDTFGRETGDWVLKKISIRIKDCLRRSDTAANVSQHDITARFGADEFGLILECLTEMADAAIVARRLIDCLTKVIVYEGNEIFLSCRIGLSVFPTDGETVHELMTTADSALSSAKGLEKNSCQFYTADLNTKAFARFTLETSLRKAVEREQFVLMYQPQVSLHTGDVIGVEALVRWIHPEMGAISPMEFIPLAEDSGLIIPIGEWVMATALEQCKQWQDKGYRIKTAINLSAAQFKSDNLIETIKRVMIQSEVDPKLIEFEITESMLMNDAEGNIVLLEELSRLGSTVSIDDFGTGYSSLNYLKRFPVDVLKVDRSFVSDLANNEDDALIVKAIVTLAHNLDLDVVAEGVEEKEQLTYLKELGCDIFQGYLVSKPVSSEEVEAFFPASWNLSSVSN